MARASLAAGGAHQATTLARCVFTRRAAYSPRPLHLPGDGGRAAARGQRPRPACPCLPIPTSWRRLQAHSATAQQSVHAVRAVPGHGGAWEVRRTDSSSSFSCACRRRGARTLSFCRIAPSKSFDSMAAAEASPPLAPPLPTQRGGVEVKPGRLRYWLYQAGAGRIARKQTRNILNRTLTAHPSAPTSPRASSRPARGAWRARRVA